MFIDLLFSPLEIARCIDISVKTVIVIDVLRASSSMIYAFSGFDNNDRTLLKGVKEIIPAKDVESAISIYSTLNTSEYLLAGEQDGFLPEGFHLGNSPSDFIVSKVSAKSLVMATTNGTRTLNLATEAKNILVGCFLNAFAIARSCINCRNDVVIACAGTGDVSGLEDITCGGLITSYIKDLAMEKHIPVDFADSALLAAKAYYSFNSVLDILKMSKHGKYLINNGFENDLHLCAAKNKFNIVPKYIEGKIVPELLDAVAFGSLYN